MANATFGLSSTGALIILDEGFTGIPPLRALYMTLAVLYCILINMKLLHFYATRLCQHVKKTHVKNCVSFSMLLCFISTNVIHSMHLVDHMYRPVYYHEPIWAYRKYLVTEVEIGHYPTLVTSIVGLLGLQKMLSGVVTKNGDVIRSSTISLLVYIVFGCLLGLVHYLAETPGNYGAMANFTISGAPIICIPFTLLITYAWTTNPVKLVHEAEARTGEIGVPLLEMENKEGSGHVTRSGTRASGQHDSTRQKSKTPVKG